MEVHAGHAIIFGLIFMAFNLGPSRSSVPFGFVYEIGLVTKPNV